MARRPAPAKFNWGMFGGPGHGREHRGEDRSGVEFQRVPVWWPPRGSLAVSGGVHSGRDAIKTVMAGAHGVQVVSALLQHGPEHLKTMRKGMEDWMKEFEWESLEPMRGNMSLKRCPDPIAYERANYVQMLQSYRPA